MKDEKFASTDRQERMRVNKNVLKNIFHQNENTNQRRYERNFTERD